MATSPKNAPEAVDDTSADIPDVTDARQGRDDEDTPEAVHQDSVYEDAEREDAERQESEDAERQESEDAGGREGMAPREQTPAAGAVRIPPQPAGIVSAATRNAEPGAMASGTADADVSGPLLTEAEELRSSWQRVMSEFVDDPRGSVARAASMVEETAETLVAAIQERERLLRSAWEGNGTAADTEDLRIALRKYRTFFEKITSL